MVEYLDQMLEAAQQARSYVAGMNIDQFMADRRTQQAVVLNLVVIGEAAVRLLRERPAFADENPGIPWRSIRGMRNRIAHGYFDLDMNLVWTTVDESLPGFVDELQRIRSDLDPSGLPNLRED
jgi:uncharacterized protein with HEPN domain